MNAKHSLNSTFFAAVVIALGAMGMGQSPTAVAGGHVSHSDVYWMWDQGGTSIGHSKLVRTPNGITAVYTTGDLPAGHAMTLWFIVFNNPAACATSPCTLADFESPEVMADFLVGGGNVTGGGTTTIGGHLNVGDTSGSGFNEFGIPEAAVGLVNPMVAEVLLALHSHGPAQTGQTLAAQISSFLGGCEVFLGPGGFASGPQDVPVNDGECSTMQASHHQP